MQHNHREVNVRTTHTRAEPRGSANRDSAKNLHILRIGAPPSLAASSVTACFAVGATFPKGEGTGVMAFVQQKLSNLTPQREREHVDRTKFQRAESRGRALCARRKVCTRAPSMGAAQTNRPNHETNE